MVPNLWTTEEFKGFPYLSAGPEMLNAQPAPIVAARCHQVAIYKHPHLLNQSSNRRFDTVRGAGAKAPASGIFRCQGCGREVIASKGEPLPRLDHHQHPAQLGNVRWRLAVATQG